MNPFRKSSKNWPWTRTRYQPIHSAATGRDVSVACERPVHALCYGDDPWMLRVGWAELVSFVVRFLTRHGAAKGA